MIDGSIAGFGTRLARAVLALLGVFAVSCDGSSRDFDDIGGGSGGQSGAGVGGSAQGGSGPGGGAGSGGMSGAAGDGGEPGCGADFSRCDGVCVDVMSDGNNCGACGAACADNLVCQSGGCRTSCEEGLTTCGTSCVDVEVSPQHCGSCNDPCPEPSSNGHATCTDSVCAIACDADYDACQGECVDFDSDPANCGGCGVACSGVCLAGECCPSDRTNCSGTCADLQTSAQNCGACGDACPAGQVCEGGSCAADCQGGDRCGNDCVDLSSDLANCGACGTACQPPASNGAAVCTPSGCDISCNPSSTRCNAACCAPSPANATTSCVTGACNVRCNTNYHACNGTTSPCYADSDVSHCGATCLDCTQPNANAACGGAQCQNTCLGYTFTCPGQNGKPACGSWDFESGTGEGWVVSNHQGTPTDLPSAYSGLFTTRTTHITSGFRALAVGHDGDGVDRWLTEIKVRLCPSGQALNLDGRTLRMDVYAETANGTLPFTGNESPIYFLFWNGANTVSGTCDVQLSADSFQEVVCPFPDLEVTDVSLLLRVFADWQGIWYIDNVRFQ